MTTTNNSYSASSGDGTICPMGMTREQAFSKAQEIADKTGESATVQCDDGEEWTVAPTLEATIHERGNGFPDVGDYVAGDDGEAYRVVAFVGPIHTSVPGAGNYIYARVALADWDDVDDEPTCSATIEADSAAHS
jgi:hypothetical protein